MKILLRYKPRGKEAPLKGPGGENTFTIMDTM